MHDLSFEGDQGDLADLVFLWFFSNLVWSHNNFYCGNNNNKNNNNHNNLITPQQHHQKKKHQIFHSRPDIWNKFLPLGRHGG